MSPPSAHSLTRPRRGSAPRATVLALLPFLVAACASQQPEHPASLSAHAPARWETVFLTPPAAAELTDYDESLLPGYARHDDDINYSPPQALVAAGQWPQPERPDLEWYRYIVLPRHADTFIYFVPGPRGW